jgi:hypothetical protein
MANTPTRAAVRRITTLPLLDQSSRTPRPSRYSCEARGGTPSATAREVGYETNEHPVPGGGHAAVVRDGWRPPATGRTGRRSPIWRTSAPTRTSTRPRWRAVPSSRRTGWSSSSPPTGAAALGASISGSLDGGRPPSPGVSPRTSARLSTRPTTTSVLHRWAATGSSSSATDLVLRGRTRRGHLRQPPPPVGHLRHPRQRRM